jgi:hypothetical protein
MLGRVFWTSYLIIQLYVTQRDQNRGSYFNRVEVSQGLLDPLEKKIEHEYETCTNRRNGAFTKCNQPIGSGPAQTQWND